MDLLLVLACIIVVHSPDGHELRFTVDHVSAIRSAEGVQEHLAKGTNAIVYAGGKAFGVIEKPEEVSQQIENCATE